MPPQKITRVDERIHFMSNEVRNRIYGKGGLTSHNNHKYADVEDISLVIKGVEEDIEREKDLKREKAERCKGTPSESCSLRALCRMKLA